MDVYRCDNYDEIVGSSDAVVTAKVMTSANAETPLYDETLADAAPDADVETKSA